MKNSTEQICIEILNSHRSVIEWGVCEKPRECYIEDSKRLKKNIKSYVRYLDHRLDRRIMHSTNNTALHLVLFLLKEHAITTETARQAVGDPCLKCKGLGFLAEYAHVENGLCFKCNGSGRSL